MKGTRFANRFLVACLLVVAAAQSPVPDTPQGFQSQYHPAFEAFQQHNQQTLEDRLDTFRMPAHWFTDSFAAAQQTEFARRYADEFAEFKRRTTTNFSGIDAIKQRVGVNPEAPVDIHTRRWTPAESKPLSRFPRSVYPHSRSSKSTMFSPRPDKAPALPCGSTLSSTLTAPFAFSVGAAMLSGPQFHPVSSPKTKPGAWVTFPPSPTAWRRHELE